VKFAAWIHNGNEEAGILSNDPQSVHSFSSLRMDYRDVLDFIIRQGLTNGNFAASADMDKLREAEEKSGRPVTEVGLQAPIPVPRHDIICLGLNYKDHAKESGRFGIDSDEKKEQSVYFSKRAVRALGSGGIVEGLFDIEGRLDYEAELALVIGKDARRVKQEDAWNYVFGLCCFNDLTARDVQRDHNQWFFGKSLDTLTAYGPYIVTMDEFKTPLRLAVRSRVNGELRQDGNTGDMIFSPDYIIEELSKGMTLDAGTIIATGTPAGVGAGFSPHRCMKAGDVCEIEIEGCGVLRNTVGNVLAQL
jgi:2-keto-4-pentenoate hydratase/2-oxohepta-3-ene-1,7-dioic acid hydratase in catechol pathway